MRRTFRTDIIIGRENRTDGTIKGRDRTNNSMKYKIPPTITFGFWNCGRGCSLKMAKIIMGYNAHVYEAIEG